MTQTIPFSRRLCARAVATTTQKRFASGNKRGRRSAERRMPTICRALSTNVAACRWSSRQRALRGALAFRRFTAALARPNASSLGSAPVPAFPETRLDGRYPRLPVSSLPSPRRPVVMPVERWPRDAHSKYFFPYSSTVLPAMENQFRQEITAFNMTPPCED